MTITRRTAVLGLGAASVGLNGPLGKSLAQAATTPSAVRPGDDFYLYADAADVAAMTIPPDRWDYGQFDVIGESVMSRIRALVERAAGRPSSGSERRVGAAYRSVLDEGAIAGGGLARLKRELARIMAAGSHDEIGALMAHPRSSTLVAFSVFPAQGEWIVYLDQLNQSQPLLELSATGYTATDAHSVTVRDAYRGCIARLFALADIPDAERRAAEMVALEGEIARRQWSFEQLRDRRANLHVMTVPELEAYAPGLPWRAMLAARGVGGVARVNLGTDSAVKAQAALFRETPVDVWRSWLAFTWMRNAIDIMPAGFRDAYWAFSGEVVRGSKTRPTRAEEALRFVNGQLRMDVARLYVEAHFPDADRRRAGEMLAYLKRAMAERLRSTDWLDAASRAEALAKLDAMALKAGYPRSWPVHGGQAALRADDAAGNLETLLEEGWAAQLDRLGKAHPQQELWYLAPQSVDASYSVLLNSIELPAAILQPPFFSGTAPMCENFGAIGALVGHEMGHGFNDQGLLFDSKGIMRDWMSADAQAAFAARAQQLVAQYGGLEPLPGLKLNGRRTLGENICDLSGVSLALRAYELYRADHGDALDLVEARRRLFLSWAKVWVYKAPDSAIRHIVENSDHAPAPCRVNGVVRNLDAWYDAFQVTEGDKLYLAPEARVRLW